MKEGDVVYIVGGAYCFTKPGSWGYLLKVGSDYVRVDWRHFTTDASDAKKWLTLRSPVDGEVESHSWHIRTEVLRVLENPPEDHDTITQLVGVLARLEGESCK